MIHEYKNSRVSLLDCIEGMKQYPDKYFDLAVVDPPYGIGDKFKGGKSGKMQFNEVVEKGWDSVPSSEYFSELFRVSQNQIIWGGNYFSLPPTRCFIVWDKYISDDFSLAMCELAWTSFDKLAKIVKLLVPKDGKIHPTQKPIALYDWIYDKYLPQGGKVLDTHLGSQSNRISAFKRGNIDFTAFELDSDYFRDGNARFDAFVAKYEPASEIDKTADGQFKMF